MTVILQLFPIITDSKADFVIHILDISTQLAIKQKRVLGWLEVVNDGTSRGQYLFNMIWINPSQHGMIRFVVIYHEFIHHLSQILRVLLLRKTTILDTLNDAFSYMIKLSKVKK